MSSPVFLYLQNNTDLYWWYKDKAINTNKIDELRFFVKNKNLVVILGSDDFACLPIDIKTNNITQLLSAVPYALENDLLSDIESLHFAIEPTSNKKNKRYIWSVDNTIMNSWLERLTDLDLKPNYLVPETALINPLKNELLLWVEQQRIIISQNETVVTINPQQLSLILDGLPKEDDSITTCQVINFDPEFMLPNSDQITFETDNRTNDNPLLSMANNFSFKNTVNLLQGEYAPSINIIEFGKKWGLSFVLSVFAATLFAIVLTINNNETREQIGLLKKATNSVYKRTFRQGKIVNAEVQMRQKLKAINLKQNKQKQFITTFLKKISDLLPLDRSIKIQKFNYQSNIFTIELLSSDDQSLNQFAQLLHHENFTITTQYISQKSKESKLTIKIKLGTKK